MPGRRVLLGHVLFIVAVHRVTSHGILVSPAPRNGANIAGDNKGGANTGACGDGNQQTKGAVSATFEDGQEITVIFNTEIAHGGEAQITIDTTEGTAGQNDDGNYDVNGNGILTSPITTGLFPCCDNRGEESMTLTIPEGTSCDNCILQWFWDGDQNYYDCADIRILATGNGGDVVAAAADTFSPSNINSLGGAITAFTLVLVCGLFGMRLRAFCKDSDLVYQTFNPGWPSRTGCILRAAGMSLMILECGILVSIPSFQAVDSMLYAFGLCVVGTVYSAALLFKTFKGDERLGERGTWRMICAADVVLLMGLIYSVALTTMRTYGTWVIADDQGESAEAQEDFYAMGILVGWLTIALLTYQLVHTMAMTAVCLPGEGLLEFEPIKRRKVPRSKGKKGSKKKSGKKSSGKKKKKKKSALADSADFA